MLSYINKYNKIYMITGNNIFTKQKYKNFIKTKIISLYKNINIIYNFFTKEKLSPTWYNKLQNYNLFNNKKLIIINILQVNYIKNNKRLKYLFNHINQWKIILIIHYEYNTTTKELLYITNLPYNIIHIICNYGHSNNYSLKIHNNRYLCHTINSLNYKNNNIFNINTYYKIIKKKKINEILNLIYKSNVLPYDLLIIMNKITNLMQWNCIKNITKNYNIIHYIQKYEIAIKKNKKNIPNITHIIENIIIKYIT